MSYAEFQQRYEIEGERERARYDRQPVARLLEAVRRGQFGGQYQLWYSIGARASLAEAGPVLADILESDVEYLHRYHCAAALIAVGKLDPNTYQPDVLSVGEPSELRARMSVVREKLRLPPPGAGGLRLKEGASGDEVLPPCPEQGRGVLVITIVLLLAVAAAVGWVTVDGVRKGEVLLPPKRIGRLSTVSLEHHAPKFWIVVSVYAAVSAGAAWGAFWLTREALRVRRIDAGS